MSTPLNLENETLSDREIATVRVFDAALEKVFAAFSDADQLAAWWGPKGFTSTFAEFDLRPGGRWRFVMHGPDGVDHDNESVFVEVLEPERIVFRHVSPPEFEMAITLAEQQGGQTRLTWHMLFKSAVSEEVKRYVDAANEENLDRLAAHLASSTSEP